MSAIFPRLFQPGYIGKVRLKNRIVRAAQGTGLANPDGSINERVLRYYRSQSQGGVGLVTVEYTFIDDDASKACNCQIGISSSEHVPGLALLAQTIQAAGAKASLQLSHAGRQRVNFRQPKAASPIPWEELYAMGAPCPLELTLDEIGAIVKAFGQAAQRAQMAEFDMIEIHACHGYLIPNFLSPRTNKRTDQYGGSFENRIRFLIEVMSEIKCQVSPDFPVVVRVSGTDYEPDGYPIEETLEVCKRLEALGVAAVHVSGGNHHQSIHEVSPMGMSHAHNVWAAEAIKKVVGIPVIASGSINLPALAESILAEGKGDFVSLGRPLFADPEWPRKAQEGRPEDIRPCIRCNDGCFARAALMVRCSVNVALCREEDYKIVKADKPKKLAVVGGGPAGMEAARVAALKGHQVTLYEKRELGGSLLEASAPEFKAPDLGPLVDYFRTQMAKLQISVVEEEATLAALLKAGYESVIVAAGATALKLEDIPGIDDPKVVTAAQVLHGEVALGDRVVVIGGGLVGTEVGLVVAEGGRQVTFVEMLDEFMCNINYDERQVYNLRFQDLDVSIHTGQRLVEVTPEGVKAVDKSGAATEFPADSVVLAAGFRPNRSLIDELRGREDIQVLEAGDCVRPRKIFDAIHEGHLAAKSLD